MLSLDSSQLGWLVLVSVFLTGYVVTWYSALKHLPVTVTASFLVLASPITTFLNAVFVNHQLSGQKIWGVIMILLAVVILVIAKSDLGIVKAKRRSNLV
jgi:drug/metabolite transporter (DMT)-like permease